MKVHGGSNMSIKDLSGDQLMSVLAYCMMLEFKTQKFSKQQEFNHDQMPNEPS